MAPTRNHPQTGRKAPLARQLLVRLRRFYRCDLEEIVLRRDLRPEPYETRTPLEVVEADRDRILRFCRERQCGRETRVQLVSYLDNHYHGLLAVLGGQTIGYVWWFDARIDPADAHPHLRRFDVTLEAGDAWSFDLHIAPQHRGGGIANDYMVRFRKHLAARGIRRLFGHVSAANLPAVWLYKVERYTAVKTVRSQLFLDAAVLVRDDGRVFLRNPLVGVKQKFDYWQLGSWRPTWIRQRL
jgi:GNAT superfamily N-acetyltransferase